MYISIHNLASKKIFQKNNNSKKVFALNMLNDDIVNKIKVYPKTSIKKAVTFCEHFVLKNSYTDLVSKNTIPIIYKTHFLDSLTLSPILNVLYSRKKFSICLDMGSGGGYPGLVISLFFSDFFFCLIDSINKKILFHKKIQIINQMKNCCSLSSRSEAIKGYHGYKNSFDIIFSRAVAELPILIELCSPFSNHRSNVILMKRIEDSREEIKNSSAYFSDSNSKIKAFYYINSKKKGKMLMVVTGKQKCD